LEGIVTPRRHEEWNGNRHVVADVYCKVCHSGAVERRLVRFLQNTGRGLDTEPQVQGWKMDGATVAPVWGFGKDGVEKVKLECGRCGNRPVVPRQAVQPMLDAVTRDEWGRGVRRFYV
jgi:hypothetical protein